MDKSAAPIQTSVTRIELPEHKEAVAEPNPQRPSLEVLNDVAVNLEIRLGTAMTTIKQLLEMQQGSMVELAQHVQQDVDVLLNGKVVARGEIVAVGDNFGVRITEIAKTK